MSRQCYFKHGKMVWPTLMNESSIFLYYFSKRINKTTLKFTRIHAVVENPPEKKTYNRLARALVRLPNSSSEGHAFNPEQGQKLES